MANKNINVRLITRNDTAAKWAEKNPILMAGEIGVETDTRKSKIGDGVKGWNELSIWRPLLPLLTMKAQRVQKKTTWPLLLVFSTALPLSMMTFL